MEIPELRTPRLHEDDRGWFSELWRGREWPVPMVQTNLSRSVRGVLRGLHYQVDHPQAKLVSVLRGAILDVTVDVRRSSPDFGRVYYHELSEENRGQLYIPTGFAHGFCVLGEHADVLYYCSDYYRGPDLGVHWADPQLAIKWPVTDPILSAKDKVNPCLAEVPPERLPC